MAKRNLKREMKRMKSNQKNVCQGMTSQDFDKTVSGIESIKNLVRVIRGQEEGRISSIIMDSCGIRKLFGDDGYQIGMKYLLDTTYNLFDHIQKEGTKNQIIKLMNLWDTYEDQEVWDGIDYFRIKTDVDFRFRSIPVSCYGGMQSSVRSSISFMN